MAKSAELSCRLNETLIRASLSESELSVIDKLQIEDSLASTNDWVITQRPQKLGRFTVCIANQQTAGRGRNGKTWQSPPNANIYISVGALLNTEQLKNPNSLSLACGVSLARMLEKMGVSVGLKWPNDILFDDKKLAGILVETRLQANQMYVVVGVGLNVNMPAQAATYIDQPWTDLSRALINNRVPLNRNELAAKLLLTLMRCLQNFSTSEFDSFKDDWKKFDLLSGRNVIIKTDTQELNAKVLGFNKDYSLRAEINQQEKTFYAADIKLKIAEKC